MVSGAHGRYLCGGGPHVDIYCGCFTAAVGHNCGPISTARRELMRLQLHRLRR